jgi:hypothetical protein
MLGLKVRPEAAGSKTGDVASRNSKHLGKFSLFLV